MATKKVNSQALVPEMRFPGCQGDWSYDTLARVLREHKRKNGEGCAVFSVSLEKGLVNQIEHMGRSFSAKDTSNYNKVLPFDIVYTKSPLRDYPYGIVKQSKLGEDVAVSPLYGVFSPRNKHLGALVEAYFDSPYRSKRFIGPLAQKGAKNTINITNQAFLSGKLAMPPSEAEQQKIADCLGSLDGLIAAQSQKIDALKTHKKGLMQQLFPREGETQPRLRFPEFENAGEWSEERLDDLVHLQDGFAFKSTDFMKEGEGATQVIRITDINNRNTNEDKVFIPTQFLERNKLGKYSVDDGDLLLSLTGAAGFNFFFWNGGRATINQRTAKVTAKRKSDYAL